MQRLRDLCEEEGYEPHPTQLTINVAVHVAETDKQARLESEAHHLWQYQNFFQSPMHDNFPPGYVSAQSLRGMLQGGYRSKPLNELSFDDLVENGWVIAGSPETVASQLEEHAQEIGAGRLVLAFNAGSMSRWLTMKSMTLFAEEVIPRMRKGGTPVWKDQPLAGYETHAEFGARRPADAPRPVATLGDGLVDVSTAHVEDLREVIEPWPPTA
jgi:alkanesulfonate monooxygenase SsuD/methylene tetrahydromethanopterin reductase-like flavin-dependent oxidoreductase (luciferase family)